MVNNTESTKYKILNILRTQHQSISGETLASMIGVSRVSIWKAIQTIQAAGYKISSTRSGYFLDKDLKDSLFPWEFGIYENLITHFNNTTSTMLEARKIAQQEEEQNIAYLKSTSTFSRIVTADHQTAGQGHNNHKWITTDGSLAFTIIIKPKISSAAESRFVMASQIAIVNALKEMTGENFFVRWPNDIWSKKGKVAGILDEFFARGSMCRWINLGIGINLINKPSLTGTDKVFNNQHNNLDKLYNRKDVLILFWKNFSHIEQLITEDSNALTNEWNKICYDIGKKVRLNNTKNLYEFDSINGKGWATFTQSTKNKITLPPGEISFVK